ncbi:MAG: 5,10-methylenetetrahydrofolate reductase [Proteobacteria bacterium]|nr:5,10-methylenetetrahydrofolate reductase [Pseudomonadota bacterium]
MSLREQLESGKFIIVSEIQPPKGIDTRELLENADFLKGRVDFVVVPDLQNAVMRLGSLATCHLLMQRGIKPVLQIACRDRNRLALQSDLLNAAVLGIDNVLVIRGEDPSLGDHPEAKPVFDLSSIELISVIQGLQKGHDMAGNDLDGFPKFFVGAEVNPGLEPGALELEISDMEKQIRMGANFFLTPAIFDIDLLEKFMRKVEHLKVPIFAGVTILKSAGMARYMNRVMRGVFVREETITKLLKAPDKLKASTEIASSLIKGMKGLCQGIYVIPIGWEKRVPAVLDAAGL